MYFSNANVLTYAVCGTLFWQGPIITFKTSAVRVIIDIKKRETCVLIEIYTAVCVIKIRKGHLPADVKEESGQQRRWFQMAFFYCFNDPLIPPTWVSLCIAKKKKGAFFPNNQTTHTWQSVDTWGTRPVIRSKKKTVKNQQQPWLGHSISDRKSWRTQKNHLFPKGTRSERICRLWRVANCTRPLFVGTTEHFESKRDARNGENHSFSVTSETITTVTVKLLGSSPILEQKKSIFFFLKITFIFSSPSSQWHICLLLSPTVQDHRSDIKQKPRSL